MEKSIESQLLLAGHIQRAVTNLKRIGQSNITVGVVQTKLEILDRKWEAFATTHEKLEMSAGKDDLALPYFADDVYGQTEDSYAVNKGTFLDYMRQGREGSSTSQKAAQMPQQLPKISLPKFSGAYAEWSPYRDLFVSMIKDNASLSDVEKLQYLKMSLVTEPLELLASIPLTAENLTVAWKLLTDRYENKRLLVSAQLASIFALPAVKLESSLELRTLCNGTANAVSALKALGRPVEGYDDFLVYLTVHKLDKQTRREWETSIGSKKTPPAFSELLSFLEVRICAVEALETPAAPSSSSSAKPSGPGNDQAKSKPTFTKTARVKSHQASGAPPATNNSNRKCSHCQQDHYIVFCEAFRAKSADERRAFVLASNLCLNCLGHHYVRECRSQKTCQSCKEKHHTMLHDAIATSSASGSLASASTLRAATGRTPTSERPAEPTDSDVAAHNAACDAIRPSSRVLLATAVVNVLTAGGTAVSARALLDQGSEASFVSESLAQRLRIPRASASVSICGIGASSAATCRGRVALTLSSRFDSLFELKLEALILPRLTSYVPPQRLAGARWPHLDGLALADPDAASNLRIDLLLGADAFPHLLLPGVKRGPPGSPIAQNTHLGWILSGQVTLPAAANSTCNSHHLSLDDSLSPSLQRFWEQEELPIAAPLSPGDLECENHFVSTHFRNSEGRYVVRLPTKEPLSTLGDSFSAASRMLGRMERRFSRDERFRQAYSDFLTEYEQLDHMEAVPSSSEEPSLAYYLPHHGVIRESSETTKFRVVFNGSQKTDTGVSLNDCLHIGPKLLPDLTDVITRWRVHAVVFSADMEKMFRQVLLHPDDRDLQRILWRRPARSQVDAYRLSTVTYGLACAPYLASRVIRQLALDERSRFPSGADALLTDVDVDDVLSGADDVPQALIKQQEIIEILKAGGFALRKWTSSSPALLSSLAPSSLAVGASFVVPTESSFHMLGLSWQAANDSFVFQLKPSEHKLPPTKRRVLSSIAELFDPLGWLAPVVVTAKIFMQTLWLLKLGWDDPLPEAESRNWLAFYDNLARISDYRIPRWLKLEDNSRDVELHGFSDASERAYAAVVYLRVADSSRSVTLVAAKTKVAPVKQVSLPRLELCAAHLLSKLAKHVREVLARSCSVHLWSDSTVTLAWIRGHPTRWKTYVANRVSEIQCSLPDATWHHIESKQNPADCASRGLFASELHAHDLWWTGPQWLQEPRQEWPVSSFHVPEDPPERRVIALAATKKLERPFYMLALYSRLIRLQRIASWCRRFGNNARCHGVQGRLNRRTSSTLLPAELSESLASLVRLEQSRFFRDEIAALEARSTISRGPLLRLNPFLDSEGLLRVGGRLKNAVLDADEKHPMILPRDSPLVPLAIDHAHSQTLHGGTQLTISTLRQRFWILSARLAVKTFIGRCIPCLRFRAVAISHLMGNLPRDRVTRSRPFLNSGVDYAGPIHLRTTKGRGHKSYKAYIAVFVCFSTKAVHLEAVSDYSTDGFLAAYKRFVSRRGLCKTISSDNGTNFVGADAELRALFTSASSDSEKICAALADDGVEWRFIPPSAPHFGGLWEAAVKSVKHHLRRVIGDSTLTFEEMTTLLAQVEACLNSRPLQPLSDDPDDLSALTPGHFLIGGPLTAVPEPTLEDVPTSRLSRWQSIQQMRDRFWSRWSTEYLHQLQARPKWQKPHAPLEIGDLVLITSELTSPARWPLARVVALHPGDDGHLRVVTVRTSTSTFKRPVVKLCLLSKKSDLGDLSA